MGQRTSYAPGTPSWVDLGSPDPDAAAAFYGGLFGWEVDADPDPAAGGYRMFTLSGKHVAGLGPKMGPEEVPPYWTVYVTVADLDAAMATAAAEGATAVVPAMDVMTAGRMGIVQDPVGSFVSLWEARDHIGCQVVNEPGTFVWNELATADLARATAFYQAVFGWGLGEGTSDEGAIFTVDGRVACGAHLAGPGEFPAWSVWFAVDDTDASVARVTELGGTVIVPPSDMGFGRGAVVADPHGAVFGIGSVTDPDD